VSGAVPELPVSVIVPCYRCGSTIDRAVASVAAQSARPAEVILVEDASGDDTLDELRRLASGHPAGWIRIVALPRNVGPAAARNAGWAQARGEYVAFLDADDAWHPRKLEIQFAFMRAHPEVALCGHGHRRIQADDEPARAAPRPGHRRISLRELLLSNRFITPSAMTRRDLPQRFREDRRHMEDHLLWMEVAASGAPVVRLDAELAYIYKAPFGESGLSADLLAMEKAELANYRQLHRDGHIGFGAMIALWLWSAAKMVRRTVLLTMRAALGRKASLAAR